MRTLEELRSAVSTRGSMRRSVSAAQILDLIAHVQQQAEQIATLTARVAALEARADARDEIDEVDAEAVLDVTDWLEPAAIPAPHVTVNEADGALCFEWWRGDEKRTLYAKADDVLRVDASGAVDDTSVPELLAWLRAAPPPPAAPAPASDDYDSAQDHAAGLSPISGAAYGASTSPRHQGSPDLVAPTSTVGDYEARARAWLLSSATTPTLATLLRTVADEARREERAACEAVCREVADAPGASQITTHVATVCADRIAARGKGE